MLLSFDRTVRALSESIIQSRCPWEKSDTSSYDRVSRFLLDQHGRMPDYLRFPFRCLTLLFDAWSLPFTGRPFHRLSAELRSKQLEAWKTSALGFKRDLVKCYESLAIFAWYSDRFPSEVAASALHTKQQQRHEK